MSHDFGVMDRRKNHRNENDAAEDSERGSHADRARGCEQDQRERRDEPT